MELKSLNDIWRLLAPIWDALRKLSLAQVSVLIGALSFPFAGVYWIGSYVATSKYSQEQSVLKNELRESVKQWERIEPHLQLKTQFSIENNIVYPYITELPDESSSVDNEFYANTSIKGLRYAKTSAKELYETFTDQEVPHCFEHIFDLAPAYVWRSDSEYSLHFDVNNSEKYTVYPNITVQKVGIPRLRAKLTEFFSCMFSSNSSTENELSNGTLLENESFQEILKQLTDESGDLSKLDIVGIYWAYEQFVHAVRSVFNENVEWSTSQIEKTPRALNGTYVNVYKKVKAV